MAGKNAEHLLHEFRNNAAADVTMSLLRSNDALLNLALMAVHLGDGQNLDGQTLTAEIDKDLPRLLRSAAGKAGELHRTKEVELHALRSAKSLIPASHAQRREFIAQGGGRPGYRLALCGRTHRYRRR